MIQSDWKDQNLTLASETCCESARWIASLLEKKWVRTFRKLQINIYSPKVSAKEGICLNYETKLYVPNGRVTYMDLTDK